jgi:hypothetical protein
MSAETSVSKPADPVVDLIHIQKVGQLSDLFMNPVLADFKLVNPDTKSE